MYHSNCRAPCPNLCDSQWQYSDNDGWHVDNSIKVACGKNSSFISFFFNELASKIFKQHIWFEDWHTFHNLLGINESSEEDLKSNLTKASQFGQANDESIGIGFIVSGLIILVIGILLSCIINHLFSIN